MDCVRTCLTIFFDGQFWVALVERRQSDGLRLARHFFGPEPGAAEIIAWLETGYARLQFVTVAEDSLGRAKVKPAVNPKRAKREAARALRAGRSVNKAHEALRLIREQTKKHPGKPDSH